MRRPTEVYNKYKYLLKKGMEKEVKDKTRVCPKNCKYNQKVFLNETSFVPLCMFGQHPPEKGAQIDVSNLITCNTTQQAAECSAYTPKYKTIDEAKEALREELKDPKVKLKKFPEIIALEWVMDNELHDLKKKPSRWGRLVLWCISKLENTLRG